MHNTKRIHHSSQSIAMKPTVIAVLCSIVLLAALMNLHSPSSSNTSVRSSSGQQNNELLAQSRLQSVFASKVLHWVQNDYSQTPGIPDPANGKIVRGNIWELVDATGTPSEFVGIYTLPDGSFHQEMIKTASGMTVVYGSDYNKLNIPGRIGTGGNRCNETPQTLGAAQLQALLPPFVAMAVPSGAKVGSPHIAPFAPLPTTPLLQGISPVQIYGADRMLTQWTQQVTQPGGFTVQNVFESGSSNRLEAVRSQQLSATGTIVGETWTTYGALQIYPVTSASTAVFSSAKQVMEGC
jgi:hypothetical protein